MNFTGLPETQFTDTIDENLDGGRRTFLRRAAWLTAAGIGSAAVGINLAGAASASTTPGTLYIGHALASGQSLRSPSGRYLAAMLSDGNFAVTGSDGTVLWTTNSAGWPGSKLNVSSTGVIALMNATGLTLWSTKTGGLGANQLSLQDDGYLVLSTKAGKSLWTTRTAARPTVAVPPKPTPPATPPPPATTPVTTPFVATPPANAASAPLAPLPNDQAFLLHLIRRATYGLSSELTADVTAAGSTQAWLDQQLNPAGIDDSACDAVLTRFPLAFLDGPTATAQLKHGDWSATQQLVHATFCRQAWSRRQLFEVMTDFWSNHLNIYAPGGPAWSTKMWDDATIIRANALGRFDTMLRSSVKSPAMLQFLSNDTSHGSAPNENYARELLELHTVGIDAGYTHADITDAARALSGLSVWTPYNNGTPANYGTLKFVPGWHYVGPVKVLGWSHPNSTAAGGPAVADSLAQYLASHPLTAQRIATKLAIRFVSDNPPQSLIDALAQTYLANATAIVPVLRALFASAEFAASVNQKYRRPAEDVLATIRMLGARPDPANASTTTIQYWNWMTADMGNAPLGWTLPDGYPDVAASWTGAGGTISRMNAHMTVIARWKTTGVTFRDLPTYLLGPTLPATRGAMMDVLFARLVPGQTIAPAHRAAMIAFLGPDGPVSVKAGDTGYLFPVLVAMILNSPYWSVR